MEQQEIDYMMSNLQDYLELHGIDTSKLFRCLNPEHNDANPSMKYFDDNKVYCFGCGASYNLVDVISIMEGLDKKESFKKAISDYCLEKPKNAYTKQVKNKAKNENLTKNYEKAYVFWQKNYKNCIEAQNYLKSRGLNEDIAERFKIGFNVFDFDGYKFNSIIIPVSNTCFTARNISKEKSKIRYYKPKGCHTELFNAQSLDKDCPYCVVTEGEIDCLSFESIGVNALALCSVNNLSKFIESDKPKDKVYILALDNDASGKRTTQELCSYFEENKIKYWIFDNCGYKDANELLVKDKQSFEEKITNMIEKIKKIQEKRQEKAEM